MTTVATDVITHVLNNTENRHVDLVEHADPFDSISQGQILRCSHNDRPGNGDLLRQC